MVDMDRRRLHREREQAPPEAPASARAASRTAAAATKIQPRLVSLPDSARYTGMSRRTFMSKYGARLKPIRDGGGKIWFDRWALDELISRDSGWGDGKAPMFSDENQEYLARQMAKRLS